jgi:hypothetical protein
VEIFASRGAPPVSTTPAAKLLPVSMTPVANFYTFFASVVDTGVVDTVSLIPVVNLELRISPRIFEKIRNGPHGILRGLGETDS